MSVYKENGVYYIRIQIGGRRIKRSAGKNATRQQALELETALRTQLHNEIHATKVGRVPDHLMSEAIMKWVKEYVIPSHKSHKVTLYRVRQLQPYFKGTLIKDAIPALEYMQQDQRSMGKAPATINRLTALVRRVLNLAYKKWGWLDQPIGQQIEMLPERNERHVYLTAKQVHALAAACPIPDTGKYVLLAAYTGLRKSELFTLTADSIRDGRIWIGPQTKTDKPRVIPIPEQILPIIMDIRLRGRIPITEGKLRYSWNIARRETGLEHITFHDLRHTYASWLAASGAKAIDIRDLLGHATLATTTRYTHLLVEHLDVVVNRLSIKEK